MCITCENVMEDTDVQFYRQFNLIKPSLSIKTLCVDEKTDVLHELIEVWQTWKSLMVRKGVFVSLNTVE